MRMRSGLSVQATNASCCGTRERNQWPAVRQGRVLPARHRLRVPQRRTSLADGIPIKGGWPVHRKFYDGKCPSLPAETTGPLVDRAERLIDYGVRQCEAFRDESLQ